MKKTLRSIGAGLCFAGLLTASSAQAILALTFDENGNSTPDETGWTITHQQATDSSTGVTTLEYLIQTGTGPAIATTGWLGINDSGGGLSDLIHFAGNTTMNGQTYAQVFFYSSDSGALADNWPTTIPLTDSTVTENSLGVALYTPTSTQPGYYEIAPNTAGPWTFLSSAVPEPTTMVAGALLLLPFGASILRMLRKNRAA